MKYKVASLFSGCGGLDTGLEMTNSFDVLWANDIYYPSGTSFAGNFNMQLNEDPVAKPGSFYSGDVERVDFTNFSPEKGIDVVTGGPPCQDFSLIRGSEKRRGMEVKRGRLYTHFVRTLANLQPKMFIFENVRGILSANKGQAFKQIVNDFQNLNYLRWEEMFENNKYALDSLKGKNPKNYEILFSDLVDFSKLGVPQKRQRAIIIGLRKDLSEQIDSENLKQSVTDKLLAPDDLTVTFPLTPLEAFAGKTLGELENEYKDIMMDYKGVPMQINSIRSQQYMSSVWSEYTFDIWHDYLLVNGVSTSIDGNVRESVEQRHKELLKELGYWGKGLLDNPFPDGSNDLPSEQDSVKDRMSFIPPGENYEFVKGTKYQVAGLMSNIYKRIHPLKPSPTVIGRGGGGTWGYHYSRNRQRLTNRERARLQTFPDAFEFKGRYSEIRRQIGEAVPPLASKRISEAILPILDEVN